MDTMSESRARLELVERIGREVAAPHADDVDRRARFPREAIGALKEAQLLGVLVPKQFGGGGAEITELVAMCVALGQHCASTAMIFAMHQIQVACMVRHGEQAAFFRQYLGSLAGQQRLIASVTSEVGVGGEIRTSIAALAREGELVRLDKDATTISYGAEADALLVTARRDGDAAPNDQVLVLLEKGDYTLSQTGAWDALGMRGTCSPGFHLSSRTTEGHVLPASFGDIAPQTMVPFSHILWASCWLGIATAAIGKARAFVRQQARSKPGVIPPSALRLAEAANVLQIMRTQVHDVASECEGRMGGGPQALCAVPFALRMNNLKVSTSQLVVQAVQHALLICGIAAYKNDTTFSLGRHLRDAFSAPLMVSNDRILSTNASMLQVLKED